METEFRLSQIPSGLDGTDATIREIIRLVDYDLKRPHLRLLATRILNHATIPSKNHTREAQALYRYVVRNVRYQKDPVGLETVQSPTVTLSVGAGDCDDHSGLIAGLGMAVGLPARLTVVGYSEDRIVHIFAELFAGGSWHAVDTTEPGHGFGWRPEGLPYQRTYNLNGEVMDMAQALQRHRISKSDFRRLLRGKVRQHLMEYWQGGVINLADVQGYLRVIDEGNFPTKQPLLVEPTREAIQMFSDYVIDNKIGSIKPASTAPNLAEMSGFLSGVWDVVKGVGKTILGIGPEEKQTIVVQQPPPPAPLPRAEPSFWSGNTPIYLGLGLLGAVIVLPKLMK